MIRPVKRADASACQGPGRASAIFISILLYPNRGGLSTRSLARAGTAYPPCFLAHIRSLRSSKLQPFKRHFQLAFTGHFLLPSVASVRLTIVVICTAACSLFCSPRFRLAESRTAGASAPRSCMGTVTHIKDVDSSASFASWSFPSRTDLARKFQCSARFRLPASAAGGGRLRAPLKCLIHLQTPGCGS